MPAYKVNESDDDRMARITLGVFVIAVGIALGGFWSIFLGAVGLVLLTSGLIGWCPLYAQFKIKHGNRFTINLYRNRFNR